MNWCRRFLYRIYRLIFKKRKSIRDEVFYINGSDTLPPPLTKEEEAEAFSLLEKKSPKARETLIVHNLRLVVYIAKKFESSGVGVEDLISIGTIGLIKAVNTFRPDKNIKLATYASRCIENEILMFLRKSSQHRNEISIDEPLNIDWDGNELLLSDILGTDEDIVNKGIETEAERDMLRDAVETLGGREKQIMQMRFGLIDGKEKTQKENKSKSKNKLYFSRKRSYKKYLGKFSFTCIIMAEMSIITIEKYCEVLTMAYNKVVISGINTSKLTVLKESEKIALLKEIQKTGSKEARDKLINGNLRLVLSVIQKFTNRGEDVDDLFQIGVVGLIKAINNFDLTKEVRFSTYCVPMIAGELRRFLRDFNHIKVSRSMRDLAYKAMQAKERLTAENQKEPTIEEVAKAVGAEKCDVVMALESISDPISLYEPVYSDSGDTLYVLDQIGDKNDVDSWLDELSLREAIKALQPREKNILYLRFFQGKTQVEVADEIGISQAQVSRLEKGALAKVKGQI